MSYWQHSVTTCVITLYLDEVALTVVPTRPEFENLLKYDYKEMVPHEDPRKGFRVNKSKKTLFKPVEKDGIKAIITHQGMWKRITDKCVELGLPFKIHDARIEFPRPRLDLMHGFRFSQKELLTDFLVRGISGCLVAPTRFGKSTLMRNTLLAYSGVTTVVTAPGVDLLEQTYQDFKEALPHRHIVQIGGSSKCKTPSEDITVCSMDSLHLCDVGRTQLLLIDEPHSAVATSRIPDIIAFNKARKLGYGATLTGRFDNRDIVLEAIIGPVLVERTYREAVKENAICEIIVLLLKTKLPNVKGFNRNQIYKKALYENVFMNQIVADIADKVVPAEHQTLVFIENEKQADLLSKLMGDAPVAMAKKMSKKERKEMASNMRYGETKRCIASDIFSTGVTFHDLKVVINAAGGGGSIGCIQKPGRLAEVRPGKKCGVMIDFLFESDDTNGRSSVEPLIGDSWARHRVYQGKGYKMLYAESIIELKQLFDEHCK